MSATRPQRRALRRGGMINSQRGEPNVAAAVSGRFGLILLSNSCTGPEPACVCLRLTNYAAAALHPAESVRSLAEVPHAVQQRRLCRFRNCAGCSCRLGSGVRLCLGFLNCAPPAVEKAGAPLLLPPIERRVSSAHGAASVTLQPIKTEEGE